MKQLNFWHDPYEPLEDGWWLYWALENKANLFPDCNITIYANDYPIMGLVRGNDKEFKTLEFLCVDSCFSNGRRLHLNIRYVPDVMYTK